MIQVKKNNRHNRARFDRIPIGIRLYDTKYHKIRSRTFLLFAHFYTQFSRSPYFLWNSLSSRRFRLVVNLSRCRLTSMLDCFLRTPSAEGSVCDWERRSREVHVSSSCTVILFRTDIRSLRGLPARGDLSPPRREKVCTCYCTCVVERYWDWF
jgi:hypothetical protein